MKQAALAIGILILLGGSMYLYGKEEVNVSSDTMEASLEVFLEENGAGGEVSQAYRFALSNPEGIMDEMPCYCGCMDTNEHESNKDCFIESPEEINEGKYFDLMGLNCGVCVKTALLIEEMYEQGKTKAEIAVAE